MDKYKSMSIFNRLAKSTGIYFLGNVSSKLIGFFMLPLYTAYISTADYGNYDLYCTYATFVAGILYFNLWYGVLRYAVDSREDEVKYKYVFSGLGIFAASTVVYCVAFIVLGQFVTINYLGWVMFFGIASSAQGLFGYYARSWGYNGCYALSGVCAAFLQAGLNIVLIVFVGMDYRAMYISYVAGIFVQTIIIAAKIKLVSRFNWRHFDAVAMKDIVRFSIPLCISTVSYWFLTSFNRVVISNILGAESNGLFSIAAKFGMMISFMVSCFTLAWQELAYTRSDHSEETSTFYTDAINIFAKVLTAVFSIMVPMVYVVFPILINENYADAKNIVPIYMLATLMDVFHAFLASIIGAYKNNSIVFISTLVSCMINIVFIYAGILFFEWGVYSGAIAMCAGFLTGCSIRIAIIRRNYNIRFKMPSLSYLIVVISLALPCYFYGGVWINVLMFFVLYTVALWIFRGKIKVLISAILKK